jgi:hypothetical protein
MQRRFAGMTLLAATLIAAAPAPKPIITIDGISSALNLDATSRAAIAKQVTALNTGLVKFVALHRSYATATSEKRAQLMREMADIHAQCKALHDAIVQQLDPTQQAAYFAYLHAQMKAAGIDIGQFQHGGMMPDGMPDHGAMHGAAPGAVHGA